MKVGARGVLPLRTLRTSPAVAQEKKQGLDDELGEGRLRNVAPDIDPLIREEIFMGRPAWLTAHHSFFLIIRAYVSIGGAGGGGGGGWRGEGGKKRFLRLSFAKIASPKVA